MKAGILTRARQGFINWCRGNFVPLPTHGWEWFLMRLFFAVLVVYTLYDETKVYAFSTQPVPSGLARLFDLTFLYQQGPIDLPFLKGPGMYDTVVVTAAVLALAYVWGRGLLVTLPLLTLLHTIVRTYSNSQGFTHHGMQLVSLTLLAQTVVVWWWQARKWRGKPAMPLPLSSYLIYYSQGVVAFSYVVSAVTKIINSKGLWIWRSNYICIELVKSHRLDYYMYLEPEKAGDPASAIWLLNHPWITRLVFDAGFFLELFAFAAMRDRVWALMVGVSIVFMHRCIYALMALAFPMHEWLVLIFLINAPFWMWWAAGGRRKGLPVGSLA